MFKRKEKENNEKTELSKGKVLRGVVTSNKMKDTVVVEITKYTKHAKYGKFLKKRNKIKAHDAGNTASIGEKVKIIETRPISKSKSFKIVEIEK